MPICKNCGNRISKFDKDICPICGYKNPLDGVSSSTIEITSQLDANNPTFKKYKPCLKIVVFVLFALCGFTGAGFFYQGFKKKGIIWLFANIAPYLLCSFLVGYLTSVGVLWSFLIFLFVFYALNILVGLYFLLKDNIKDANGEFLK